MICHNFANNICHAYLQKPPRLFFRIDTFEVINQSLIVYTTTHQFIILVFEVKIYLMFLEIIL